MKGMRIQFTRAYWNPRVFLIHLQATCYVAMGRVYASYSTYSFFFFAFFVWIINIPVFKNEMKWLGLTCTFMLPLLSESMLKKMDSALCSTGVPLGSDIVCSGSRSRSNNDGTWRIWIGRDYFEHWLCLQLACVLSEKLVYVPRASVQCSANERKSTELFSLLLTITLMISSTERERQR